MFYKTSLLVGAIIITAVCYLCMGIWAWIKNLELVRLKNEWTRTQKIWKSIGYFVLLKIILILTTVPTLIPLYMEAPAKKLHEGQCLTIIVFLILASFLYTVKKIAQQQIAKHLAPKPSKEVT